MSKSKSDTDNSFLENSLSVTKSVALHMPNLLFLEKQKAQGTSISKTVRNALDFFEEYLKTREKK